MVSRKPETRNEKSETFKEREIAWGAQANLCNVRKSAYDYGIILPVLMDYFAMCILDEMQAKREEIYAIARAHKAEKLWVFGSCARTEEAVAI